MKTRWGFGQSALNSQVGIDDFNDVDKPSQGDTKLSIASVA